MTNWDITPKILLEHMQAMRIELVGKMDRLESRVDTLEIRLTSRIEGVERRLTRQIDMIDQHLDAIEIENLPKRIAALEATRK